MVNLFNSPFSRKNASSSANNPPKCSVYMMESSCASIFDDVLNSSLFVSFNIDGMYSTDYLNYSQTANEEMASIESAKDSFQWTIDVLTLEFPSDLDPIRINDKMPVQCPCNGYSSTVKWRSFPAHCSTKRHIGTNIFFSFFFLSPSPLLIPHIFF
jgi:hypothetical protein